MPYKVYIENNYFVIEDTDNGNKIELAKPKSTVSALVEDNELKISLTSDRNFYREYSFSDLVDSNENPFVSESVLQAFLRENTGFNTAPGGSGAPTGVIITQNVDSYSDLVDGTANGDLAYTKNSEGTAWLPGTLGGSYYPKGFYVWNGTDWVSDRNAIAEAISMRLVGNKNTSTANPVGGALNIDWSAYSSWIFTLTEATVLTESNAPALGENGTITLYVTGDFPFDLVPAWLTNFNGSYIGTALNQIVVEKAGSIYYTSVYQPA